MQSAFPDPAFLTREQREQLRAYVMAEDSGIQNQSDTTVRLHVSHSNLKQTRMQEIRLDRHMLISSLKHKLISHTGTNPSAMILQLFDEVGNLVASGMEDGKKLGFYSPADGWRVHVIDTDPTSASANGWLEDVSKVEKYMMSDAEYDKRENTYRKFKADKLKEDPEWTLEKELAKRRGVEYVPKVSSKVEDPDFMKAEAEGMAVGMRCSCEPGDRRGEVKFVGTVDGLPLGWWIGVQYDEPLGKNDGSVKGKRIFECPANFGGFLRPDKVKVGDFPPIEEEDSDFGSEPDEI